MKYYLSLIFVLILCQSNLLAQSKEVNISNLSERTIEIIDAIPHRKFYTNSYPYIQLSNGIGGGKSREYKFWLANKDGISDDELLVLVDHDSPSVRFYIYHEIMIRGLQDEVAFIAEHLSDTVMVSLQLGCEVKHGPLIEHIIKAKRKKAIDAILITEPNNFAYTDRVLTRLQATDTIYYDRIKELVTKGNWAAMVPFIKFDQSTDSSFIHTKVLQILLTDTNRQQNNIKNSIIHAFGKRSNPPIRDKLIEEVHHSILQYLKQKDTLSINQFYFFYNGIMRSNYPQKIQLIEDIINYGHTQNRLEEALDFLWKNNFASHLNCSLEILQYGLKILTKYKRPLFKNSFCFEQIYKSKSKEYKEKRKLVRRYKRKLERIEKVVK